MQTDSIVDDYMDKLLGKSILLHVCCAPCSCIIIEELFARGVELGVYFFNPNITPYEEYRLRKKEVLRFIKTKKINIYDDDYDYQSWLELMRGLENEPERGRRCSSCFLERLRHTALKAVEYDFDFFATSLGISRYKDLNDVNKQAHKAALEIGGRVTYLDINWRKRNGAQKGDLLAKKENFYRQKYCGCEFSCKKD